MSKRITSILVSALLSLNIVSTPLLAANRTVTTSEDGDVISTQTDKNGELSNARVQIALDTWKLAFDTNEPVLLQMEALDGNREASDPVSLQITLPQSGPEILVGIPLKDDNAGTVAMVKNPTRLEPVQKSFVSEHILYVPLNQSRTVFILDGRKSFPDLKDDWQSEGIHFASSRQIMNGYENGDFGPEDELDRGMLIRMLYNLEGSEDIGEYRSEFPDVEGTFYTTAVHWAAREHLLEGYSDGLFHAQDVLTREQIATILYRHARVRMNERVLESSDSGQVSTFALPAMSWAKSKGILSENDKDELDPQGSVTRGMAATVIKRYLSLLDSGEPLLSDEDLENSGDGSQQDPGSNPPAGSYVSLHFESRGGTEFPVRLILKGELPGQAPVPVLEGYLFDGWYSDASFNTPFDWNTPLNQETTLYARWIEDENKHGASNEDPEKPGEDQDGSSKEDQDNSDGSHGENGDSFQGDSSDDDSSQNGSTPEEENPDRPNPPASNGPSNSGGSSNNGNSSGQGSGTNGTQGTGGSGSSSEQKPSQDVTSKTFTVSFMTNNGVKVESVKVQGGKTLNAFPILYKDGYEVEGWYKDADFFEPFGLEDMVVSDLVLHARWKPVVIEYTYGLNANREKVLVAINGKFASEPVKSLSQAKNVIQKVGQDFYGKDFDVKQGSVTPDSTGYYKNKGEVLYRYTPRNYRNPDIKGGLKVDKGQILLLTTSSGTVKALYSSYCGGTEPGINTNLFINEEEAKEVAVKYLMNHLDSLFRDNEFDYLGDFTILKDQLLDLLKDPEAFSCELVLDPEARGDQTAMAFKVSLNKLPVRTFVEDGWAYMWYETPEKNNRYNAFGIEWTEDISLPFRQGDSFSYLFENLYSDKEGVSLVSFLDPGVDYLKSEPQGDYDESTHSVRWANTKDASFYDQELRIDVQINERFSEAWDPVSKKTDGSTTDASVDNRQIIFDGDQEVNIARSEVTVIDRSEENPKKYEDQMIDIMKVFYVHADQPISEDQGEISEETVDQTVYRVDDLAQKASAEIRLPDNKPYRIEVRTEGNTTYLVDGIRKITTNRAQVDALTGARTTIAGEVAKYDKEHTPANAYLLHANMERVYDYYLNTLGLKSYDGKGAELVTSYDYSQYAGNKEYHNAMWIPAKKMFAFGSNYGTALDIVAHEYTHAVINSIVGGSSLNTTLSYSGESGALNEAYSDILGNLIEEGKATSDTWQVGELVTNKGRKMENDPGISYREFITSKQDEDVHDNSTLFSHAAYLMMRDPACQSVSSESWFKLFYNSLHYLSKDATMLEAGAAVQMAAKDLGFSSAQQQAVKSAFESTGIRSFS